MKTTSCQRSRRLLNGREATEGNGADDTLMVDQGGKRGLEISILGVYSVPDLFLGRRAVAVKSPKRAFYEVIKIDAFPRQKRQTESFFVTSGAPPTGIGGTSIFFAG